MKKPFKDRVIVKFLISAGRGLLGNIPIVSQFIADYKSSETGLTEGGKRDWVQLLASVVMMIICLWLVSQGYIKPEHINSIMNLLQ